MPRVVYVNGRYQPYGAATVHIDDRGYQFADAVYEVLAIANGKLLDEAAHHRRLARSLAELRIPAPMSAAPLSQVMRRVVRLNRVQHGILYLQISRGVAPRDHAFPVECQPQLVITARRKKPADPRLFAQGVAIISIPDIRWGRCDIKSTSLLANVLGKQQARDAGAYEAWQVVDGDVTEGTASNAWIVTQQGSVVTRTASDAILNGITRLVVIALAKQLHLTFEERAFSLEEARNAREAFITGTTAHVLPVTSLDGAPIGDGVPGPLSRQLLQRYLEHMAKQSA